MSFKLTQDLNPVVGLAAREAATHTAPVVRVDFGIERDAAIAGASGGVRERAARDGGVVAQTHRAATDAVTCVARLERLSARLRELVARVDRRQPETQRRRVIVAGAPSGALDEGTRAEVFQAASGRVQNLPTAFATSARVLRTQMAPRS